MNKELEKLYKEEAKIKAEIYKIENEEIEKKQKPLLKKMVGKCFIYHKNCYSCPNKPSDYWDTFRKILEWIDPKEQGFHFIYEEFQTDKYGKVSWIIDETPIYFNKEWWDKNPFVGFKEITKQRYEKEKTKMIAEMSSHAKMKKVLNYNAD